MKDYIKPGEKVDFYTVIESAKRKGQTAIGYRIASLSQDNSKAYGINCNPVKSNSLIFTEEDKLIVLAED